MVLGEMASSDPGVVITKDLESLAGMYDGQNMMKGFKPQSVMQKE
jgi:hypothetical protein